MPGGVCGVAPWHRGQVASHLCRAVMLLFCTWCGFRRRFKGPGRVRALFYTMHDWFGACSIVPRVCVCVCVLEGMQELVPQAVCVPAAALLCV